ADVNPSLEYIREYEADLHTLHVAPPHIWGVHNYSDVNRFSSSRTRALLATIPHGSEVWLTETGGIVQFGGSFPFSDSRANRAAAWTFQLAHEFHQITRVYYYTWDAATGTQYFD